MRVRVRVRVVVSRGDIQPDRERRHHVPRPTAPRATSHGSRERERARFTTHGHPPKTVRVRVRVCVRVILPRAGIQRDREHGSCPGRESSAIGNTPARPTGNEHEKRARERARFHEPRFTYQSLCGCAFACGCAWSSAEGTSSPIVNDATTSHGPRHHVPRHHEHGNEHDPRPTVTRQNPCVFACAFGWSSAEGKSSPIGEDVTTSHGPRARARERARFTTHGHPPESVRVRVRVRVVLPRAGIQPDRERRHHVPRHHEPRSTSTSHGPTAHGHPPRPEKPATRAGFSSRTQENFLMSPVSMAVRRPADSITGRVCSTGISARTSSTSTAAATSPHSPRASAKRCLL